MSDGGRESSAHSGREREREAGGEGAGGETPADGERDGRVAQTP